MSYAILFLVFPRQLPGFPRQESQVSVLSRCTFRPFALVNTRYGRLDFTCEQTRLLAGSSFGALPLGELPATARVVSTLPTRDAE